MLSALYMIRRSSLTFLKWIAWIQVVESVFWSQGYMGLHCLNLKYGNPNFELSSNFFQYLSLLLLGTSHMDLVWRYSWLSYTVQAVEKGKEINPTTQFLLDTAYWLFGAILVSFSIGGFIGAILKDAKIQCSVHISISICCLVMCFEIVDALWRIRRAFKEEPDSICTWRMAMHFSCFFLFSLTDMWRLV